MLYSVNMIIWHKTSSFHIICIHTTWQKQNNPNTNVSVSVSVSVSLSVLTAFCFKGHFPGEPGLAGVYSSKGWWKRW